MNLKEKLTHVFSLLGLTQKAKDQSLTDEEWKTVVNRFQQEYKVTLQEAMAEENNHSQDPVISQEEITAAYTLLQDIVAEQNSGTDTTTEEENAEEEPGRIRSLGAPDRGTGGPQAGRGRADQGRHGRAGRSGVWRLHRPQQDRDHQPLRRQGFPGRI